MKKLIMILMLISSMKSFAQDSYFLGKTNYCTPEKEDSKKKFDAAILALNSPKYYNGVTQMLLKAVKEDPTYCDAHFLAGYYFRLQDMQKEATVLYYIADSLSQNKAPIFKQNLAIQFMRLGQVERAREKYEEMIRYFPENPEGYYGKANTSVVIGDYEAGITNLKKAEQLYRGSMKDDGKYMYGILYALNEKYKDGLLYLEDVYSSYKNDDNYVALYALSQIKVGKSNNDEKLIKKARKNYDKIKGKPVTEDVIKKLQAEFP
ncbi:MULTISPECIES: hypothetical protein [unclassified Chryseobacterium]|uniref:hypothetical protein n=1 Tax=unclassified Chryseobacterium TaxID=2593645 RepID=UPI00104070C6|nr:MULTISPECIES: hypothetical protein [unclassified Chryseobacterium]